MPRVIVWRAAAEAELLALPPTEADEVVRTMEVFAARGVGDIVIAAIRKR